MTESHKIGLVLGSGAARGWVHKGAFVALDELGITPDVITGCSAGALVASARLLDILPAFEKWARELGPLGALKDFAFGLGKAGIIDPTRAFESFREYDRKIEELPLPFGMTATDLVTGEEVRLTSGSVLDAARASSSIPMLFHAAKMPAEDGSRWLVDGALTNPVPVDLALELGATKTIAIDLQAHSRTLERFVGPRTRALVVVEEPEVPQHDVIPHQVMELIHRTQNFVERQMALAKSRMDAEPHFMETVIATSDIYQTHLARAKLALCPPDVLIAPDTRNFPPTAFDQPDEMTALGYQAVMDQKDELLALKQGS